MTEPTPPQHETALDDQIRWCADAAAECAEPGARMLLAASLREIAERAEKAEVERAAFRRGFEEIYTERNQLAATLDRVRAAMDEIEERAREAEQAGTASACCALWVVRGLVQDALDPQPQQDAPQRHAGGPAAAETGTQP